MMFAASDATSSRPTRRRDNATIPTSNAAAKHRRRYRWKIIIGLLCPFTLLALDGTVIASASPYIATDFNKINELNWISSAFNLTSAAFLPLWGQLIDVFGRHTTMQASLILMIVGSAICTGAPTSKFSVLLLGRAIQGIATAGLNICTRTIVADRVSLFDYALAWTILTLLSGSIYSVGSVVGGYLTEESWRWCFAINLPFAGLAIILIVSLLRKELIGPQPIQELESQNELTRCGFLRFRFAALDYIGHILFLLGLGLLCLGLTWAGGTYTWKSAAVIVPIAIGASLSVCWVVHEQAMSPGHFMSRILPRQQAMMPWILLSRRDSSLIFFLYLTVGISQVAITYLMALYFAVVQGWSSGKAGTAMLYYVPGLAVGTYMAIFSSNVWPRQTLPALLLGSITSAVGITVLAWSVSTDHINVTYGMMALVGHGVMIRMNPGALHLLGYFPTLIANISSLVSFAIPLGGLIGLTIMSAMFTNKSGPHQEHSKNGVMWALIAVMPFIWISVPMCFFMGNVWISRDGGHDAANGAYLWSLITKKELTRQRVSRGYHVERMTEMSTASHDGPRSQAR